MDEVVLSFSGDKVKVAGRSWKAEYPIREAILSGDKVIVLYDPYSFKATFLRSRQFRNLAGYNLGGVKLWTAEHPTNEAADVYMNIMSVNPFKVWSFACFVCEINPEDGKLIHAVFTK
jgi:hypothetical protein